MSEAATPAGAPSLYQRLGGVYAIATVVDDFIDRVMADGRLNANPAVDEAHHKVPPAGFKYLVTEMLCWAAGGPQTYTGRDMPSSHRHLNITAGERGAFIDDLDQTLDKIQAPKAEQPEVVAIVQSTHGDIVAGHCQHRRLRRGARLPSPVGHGDRAPFGHPPFATYACAHTRRSAPGLC